MGSAVLTSQDVADEIERLAAESGYGYVQVIVAGGRIERIDRCVQVKAPRPVAYRRRFLTRQGAERD